MPECLLLAYHDNLDRLRAERSIDAAQAASVPHLTREGHASWYRAAQKRTRRRIVSSGPASPEGTTTGALFTVNGQPVDKHGLARWLAVTFGAPTSRPALTTTSLAPRPPANGHVRP